MPLPHEFIDELNRLPPLDLGSHIVEWAEETLNKISSPERQADRPGDGPNDPTHKEQG